MTLDESNTVIKFPITRGDKVVYKPNLRSPIATIYVDSGDIIDIWNDDQLRRVCAHLDDRRREYEVTIF